MKKILQKQNLWRVLAAVFTSLMLVGIFLAVMLLNNASFINMQFAIASSREIDESPEGVYARDVEHFTIAEEFGGTISGSSLYNVTRAAHRQTISEVEEGAVLFRNESNALPLRQGARITLFGRASINPTLRTSSIGTTEHSRGTSRVHLHDALATEGFVVNPRVTSAKMRNLGYRDIRWQRNTLLLNGNMSQFELPLNFYTEGLGSGADAIPLTESFASYNDAAIMVLTRFGGEGNGQDVRMRLEDRDGNISGYSQLALQYHEHQILQLIKSHNFGTIVVLINTVNQMELCFAADPRYGIDAGLIIGSPGLTGFTGVARILSGAVNPSGRTTSTWAKNSLSSPAVPNANCNTPDWANFPDRGLRESGIIRQAIPNAQIRAVQVQLENIYIGYKYYSTRHADAVRNLGNARSGIGAFGAPARNNFWGSYEGINCWTDTSSANEWRHENEVILPFGFGLSYTTFSEEILSATRNFDAHNPNRTTWRVEVRVTNTGDIAGKNSTLIFASVPFDHSQKTTNVEKAFINLVGFGKTVLLQPNTSQILFIEFEEYLFASYDTKANNGQGGFVLDAGEYFFAVGNAYTAANNVLYAMGNGVYRAILYAYNGVQGSLGAVYRFEVQARDEESFRYGENGFLVQNQFEQKCINYWNRQNGKPEVTYLTRLDWAGTFPRTLTNLYALGDVMQWGLNGDFFVPGQGASTADFAQGIANHWQGVYHGIRFFDMRSACFYDERWERFLDQIPLAELVLFPQNNFGNTAIPSVVLPSRQAGDGSHSNHENFPTTHRHTGADLTQNNPLFGEGNLKGSNLYSSLLANSFNVELMERRGFLMGQEALFKNHPEKWGGGGNLHRTPFGGRQFEYFSECANLTSKVLAAKLPQFTKSGVVAGPKHFAGNDQETFRVGISVFYTEQSFRENALRGFEFAFRNRNVYSATGEVEVMRGGVRVTMLTYSRQGVVYSPNVYALVGRTGVLRGEWGFRGRVITDANVNQPFRGDIRGDYTTQIVMGSDSFCVDGRGMSAAANLNTVRNYDCGVLLYHLRRAARNSAYAWAHSNLTNWISPYTRIVLVTPLWMSLTYGIMSSMIFLGIAAIAMYVLSIVFKRKKIDEATVGTLDPCVTVQNAEEES